MDKTKLSVCNCKYIPVDQGWGSSVRKSICARASVRGAPVDGGTCPGAFVLDTRGESAEQLTAVGSESE